MTIQFSRQAIAAVSLSLPTRGSGLVRRLVRARNDPGKERVRMWLLNLDDAQLQSGLGLTPQDIAVLRAGNGALELANPGTDDTTNGPPYTLLPAAPQSSSRAAISESQRLTVFDSPKVKP